MRDRKRLIEVLWTVNRNAVGPATLALHAAAAHLELDDPAEPPAFILARLIAIDEHPSPHIRELAREAYGYLWRQVAA